MWWRRAAWVAAGLMLAAPVAGAAGPLEAPDLPVWLTRTTDLDRSQVALVSADSVYSIEPLGERLPTGEIIVLVRTEPLGDDWGATHGFQSWDANLLIDCAQRRLRVIRSATYPKRNRGGAPAPEPQDYAARKPLATEPAAKLLAAACDANFAWPLREPPRARTYAMAMLGGLPPPDVPRKPVEPAPAPAPQVVEVPTATVFAPAAPPAAASPIVPSRWVLQVALGASAEGAQRAAGAARKALGAEAKALTGWTVSTPEAPQEYAGLVGAFASYGAAHSACQTLRSAKQDCLIRRDPAGSPTPGQAAPPSQPAATTVAASPPAPAAHAVQVARGPSEEGARRALAKARKALGPLAQPLRDAMPVSRIPGDHIRYDARLEGFATAEAAAQACRTLSAAGQDCFLPQPPSAGPA